MSSQLLLVKDFLVLCTQSQLEYQITVIITVGEKTLWCKEGLPEWRSGSALCSSPYLLMGSQGWSLWSSSKGRASGFHSGSWELDSRIKELKLVWLQQIICYTVQQISFYRYIIILVFKWHSKGRHGLMKRWCGNGSLISGSRPVMETCFWLLKYCRGTVTTI